MVAPGIVAATGYLKSLDARGVQTMRDELVKSLDKRFKYARENEASVLAQALDPRYKLSLLEVRLRTDWMDIALQLSAVLYFFSSVKIFRTGGPGKPIRFQLVFSSLALQDKVEGRNLLATKCASPVPSPRAAAAAGPTLAGAAPGPTLAGAAAEPPERDMWAFFEDSATSSGSQPASQAATRLTVNGELDTYLAEPRITNEHDPLAWWRLNKHRFPLLWRLARRYLSAPATSVPSERLFSTAGGVVSDSRNRLTPSNSEMLVFLHDNLRIMNFKY